MYNKKKDLKQREEYLRNKIDTKTDHYNTYVKVKKPLVIIGAVLLILIIGLNTIRESLNAIDVLIISLMVTTLHSIVGDMLEERAEHIKDMYLLEEELAHIIVQSKKRGL